MAYATRKQKGFHILLPTTQQIISIVAKRNKARRAHIKEQSIRICALEQAHKQTLATKALTDLLKAKEGLLEELNKTLKRKYALTQKVFYEFGNKSRKLLARALQLRKAASTIHTIKDPAGNTFITPEAIADQFIHYLTKLYNLPTTNTNGQTPDRRETIDNFLKQYSPTPITMEESAELNHPILLEETIAALKQLKMGKSPGPDGLTVSYYKSFTNVLFPYFTKAFNFLSSSPQANKDILKAHITLTLKPGKDTTMVSDYRPISLLNVNLKLYAKVLANRLLPLLSKLISLEQVGFIPGWEARDNTIKAINIHHWLPTTSKPGFLLSLDEEKALDRVAWQYMTAILQAMGFPDHILQLILALYSSPTAKIRANGRLPYAFSISNEDDILLFLSDPLTTIPSLLKDFALSNQSLTSKLIFQKALNISLPSAIVTQCQTNFPFS